MIFKCYLCSKYKFWNRKTCYSVIVTGGDEEELFTKKICQPCGDEINSVYEENKSLANIEVNEDE